MCVLTAVLGRRGKKQPALGTALCVLYEAVLYLGGAADRRAGLA